MQEFGVVNFLSQVTTQRLPCCRMHALQLSAKPLFCLQTNLVLIDEVHLLNEQGRGSSLEAGTVSRIKMVKAMPELRQVRNCLWLLP
jgi:hypothetical protein